MSDQATGGDGSVRWSVDAENVREHQVKRHDNNRHEETAVDRAGKPGEWFTVSIKVPQDVGSVDEYLRRLRNDNDLVWGLKADPDGEERIEFNVKIEAKTPTQIRVSWGSSGHVHPPADYQV
jgi:hypothetical protein